jgi:3-phosphoshikimate 1-carboxyvinyltransferase
VQATVEEGRDFCVIHPPERVLPGVEIETYDDHRMVSMLLRVR